MMSPEIRPEIRMFVAFLLAIFSAFRRGRLDGKLVAGYVRIPYALNLINASRYLASIYRGQFRCSLPEVVADEAPLGTPPGPPTLKGKAGKRARKAYRLKCLRVLLRDVLEANLSIWVFSEAVKEEIRQECLSMIEEGMQRLLC